MTSKVSKLYPQSPKQSKQPHKSQQTVEPPDKEREVAIVGIGASAGGFSAIRNFLSELPANTGMAFVVVTHLHPELESHLVAQLQGHIKMPVMQVTKRTKVEADHIYIIPPNRRILLSNTHLGTREVKEPGDQRTLIDSFLQSLAVGRDVEPIAVILSGDGTDGSTGIKDISEAGGLIMVQEPDDAEYDSMPRAALSTGLVDICLPASQLAQKLTEYIRNRSVPSHDPGQFDETELENLMAAIDIPALYLDRDLHIQHYTAGVKELFSMIKVDHGKHISDLTRQFKDNRFVEDAEQVLRKLTPVEREIQSAGGNWFLMRMHPYRTREDRIQGVAITYMDITRLKDTERELNSAKTTLEESVQKRTRELAIANEQIRQARDMFFTLFYSNPIPTSLTHMEDGKFIDVNDAYLEFAGMQREELVGHTSQELQLPIATEIRPYVLRLLQKNRMVRDIELQIKRRTGEVAIVLASIQLVTIDQGQSPALLLSFIDITERVKAEQQIRSLAYDLTKVEQEERHRISQILHDDLQQRIFAVKMQLQSLLDAYKRNDLQSAQVDFFQLQEWLDESISITRNLSIDLSPAVLNGEGLTDALIWLSSQMWEQYGLDVTIIADGVAGRFENTMRILLFQAVREFLFNIVKHANTLHATIEMKRVDGHTRITVTDNGAGFDADQHLNNPDHTGGTLKIKHRLNLMGCGLQVHSEPNGQGTRVIIDVPLDE